jgi:hypothetical protein
VSNEVFDIRALTLGEPLYALLSPFRLAVDFCGADLFAGRTAIVEGHGLPL